MNELISNSSFRPYDAAPQLGIFLVNNEPIMDTLIVAYEIHIAFNGGVKLVVENFSSFFFNSIKFNTDKELLKYDDYKN